MKKQTLIAAISISLFLFSPLLWRASGGEAFAQLSGINYQAVAVDEAGKGIPGMDINGQAIPNKSITVRFSILAGSPAGTLLYQETHNTNTDLYGLFSLVIGTGTVTSSGQYSTLTQIPWQTANQFLKVEIDIKNDGNYKLVSVQQLMAVPYAFYAAKSDTAAYALNADTSAGTTTGWKLTGNDSINPSTQFIGTTDSVDFVFRTNNNEKMRLTGNGNIGVGTTNPNGLGIRIGGQNLYGRIIDVKSIDLNAVRLFHSIYNINTGLIQEYDGTTFYSSVGNISNHKFAIKTNNLERITIDTNGNIGVGTTTPGYLQENYKNQPGADFVGLAVTNGSGNNNSDASILLQGNQAGTSNRNLFIKFRPNPNTIDSGWYAGYDGTNDRYSMGLLNGAGVVQTPSFIIKPNGNVGIGTTNPTTHLLISGEGSFDPLPLAGTTGNTIGIADTRTYNTPSLGGVILLGGTYNSAGDAAAFAGIRGVKSNTIDGNYSGQLEFFTRSNGDLSWIGDQRMVISSAGNVGIGTTTPAALLDIAGQVKITDGTEGAGKILTSDANGLATWTTPVTGGVDSVTAIAPVFSTSGANPQISVAANSQSSAGVVDSGGTNYNKVWKTDAGGNPGWRSDSSDFAWTPGTGLTLSGTTLNSVWTSSGADIYNNNTGNVGIGTSTPDPTTKLHVSGGGIGLDNNNSIWWKTNSGIMSNVMYLNTQDKFLARGLGGGIGFLDGGGNELVTITNAGNVGIGTTTPASRLDISDNTNPAKLILRSTGAGNVGISLQQNGYTAFGIVARSDANKGLAFVDNYTEFTGDGSGTDLMRITWDGKIGIGTSSPTERLEIVGNTKVSTLAGTGIRMVQADSNGVLIPLAADSANKVLLGTGVWGNVPTTTAWSLNGNAGTDSTNFIGTTDNIPFNVRVNNEKAGRIDPSKANTFWGYKAGNATNTGASNTAIGDKALKTNTIGLANTAIGAEALNSNTFGSGGIAIGYQSLYSNTTGLGNIAVGATSLYSNTLGDANIAIGPFSLFSNTSSSASIAIGDSALYSNTVDGSIAIGAAALLNNTTGAGNVAVGPQALYSNTTGGGNIATGDSALYRNTTGDINVAYGTRSLFANTTGTENTAIGAQALYKNTTGNYNTAQGAYALYSNTSNWLTATGAYSLYTNTTGVRNTADGYKALYSNTTGSWNTASGHYALYSNDTGIANTAIGAFALRYNTLGNNNTSIGEEALYTNTTGSLNTALGAQAMYYNTGDYNSAMGYQALFTNTTGTQNTAVGMQALLFNTTGDYNTALGQGALITNSSGQRNTATGTQALYLNNTGNYNTATGMLALRGNISGSYNTATGNEALYKNTGDNNTAHGANTLHENTSGTNNTAIGTSSLYTNNTGSDNTATGVNALYNNTSGGKNTATGRSALYSNTSGNANTAVGVRALFTNSTGSLNTGIGDSTLFLNTSGTINTAIGRKALYSNSTGNFNTASGGNALYSNTSGNNNAAYGYNTLYANSAGSGNTALGDSAMFANTSGSFNTSTGISALKNNTIGIYNSAYGGGALYFNSSGNYNTANGAGALLYNFSGVENTATGAGALYYNINGNKNVADGYNALKNNASGSYNTAVGENALKANLIGTYNTAIGYQAYDTGTAFTNSTAIGYKAQITASNTIQLGNNSITDVKTSGAMTANGYTTAFSTQSGNYTLTALDDIVAVTGTTTISLPTAVGIAGRKYTIKNIDPAQTITVDAFGSETIDGALTKTLTTQYQHITIISDGSDWLIVANN